MSNDQNKQPDTVEDTNEGVDQGRRAFLQRSGLIMAGLVLGAKLGNSPSSPTTSETTAQNQAAASISKQNASRSKYDDDLDRIGMPGGK